MAEITQFTAAEAAFVLREPVRAVKKAMDQGPVRAGLLVRAGVTSRVIAWSDLFYLFAVQRLREDLTPAARGKFHATLGHTPAGGDEVRFGRFRVAVGDLVDELRQRIAQLAELKTQVAFDEDGKAILDPRGVEVHRIAALLNGGLSMDAVLEEYPFLSRAAVEAARDYAQVSPRPGRPYPRTTASRARRESLLAPPETEPEEDR